MRVSVRSILMVRVSLRIRVKREGEEEDEI